MAIKIEKIKLNHSNAIRDNSGFTFILEDNSEGFGFITLSENLDTIITVIVLYDNGKVDRFSNIIGTYDNINPSTSIKIYLEKTFESEVIFIKEYEKLENMNIIVDLEAE